jgi:multidrug efflux pump
MFMAREAVFQRLLRSYSTGLRWVLNHQPLMLAVTIAAICLNVSCLHHRAQGIFPAAGYRAPERRRVGAQDISFPAMMDKVRTIRQNRSERSGRTERGSLHGRGSGNTGRVIVELKDIGERKIERGRRRCRHRAPEAQACRSSRRAGCSCKAYQDMRVGALT